MAECFVAILSVLFMNYNICCLTLTSVNCEAIEHQLIQHFYGNCDFEIFPASNEFLNTYDVSSGSLGFNCNMGVENLTLYVSILFYRPHIPQMAVVSI